MLTDEMYCVGGCLRKDFHELAFEMEHIWGSKFFRVR
jgi:hypothetical protein